MVSQEEAAAAAVEEEEVAEGQLLEQHEVAEQEQPKQENDGVVEASSDDGASSEAPSTTTTQLYFGNLSYNCDSAQLASLPAWRWSRTSMFGAVRSYHGKKPRVRLRDNNHSSRLRAGHQEP
ncbi:uncharacterized protein LOC112902920 [Panicum hallii]|uniref:uncharacterized protein LOC112902920 n=1 Tax=Panicum hallii TaxID=206008 RepID=UPI000DF4DABD|nr:uncharacterized protein LOC112902920 [Panicum hallii]